MREFLYKMLSAKSKFIIASFLLLILRYEASENKDVFGPTRNKGNHGIRNKRFIKEYTALFNGNIWREKPWDPNITNTTSGTFTDITNPLVGEENDGKAINRLNAFTPNVNDLEVEEEYEDEEEDQEERMEKPESTREVTKYKTSTPYMSDFYKNKIMDKNADGWFGDSDDSNNFLGFSSKAKIEAARTRGFARGHRKSKYPARMHDSRSGRRYSYTTVLADGFNRQANESEGGAGGEGSGAEGESGSGEGGGSGEGDGEDSTKQDNSEEECKHMCIKSKLLCPKDFEELCSCLVSIKRHGAQEEGDHVCSGIVIGKYNVLTPAHCIDCRELGLDELEYTVGPYYDDNSKTRDRIFDVYVHPKTRGVLFHDLAIIKVDRGFDLDVVKPAEIGSETPPNLEQCYLIYPLEEEYKIRPVTVRTKLCDELKENLEESHLICAEVSGNDKKKNCRGDTGSPLLCNEKFVGLISSKQISPKCESESPVYTDLTGYKDWIDSNTPNKSKGTSLKVKISFYIQAVLLILILLTMTIA